MFNDDLELPKDFYYTSTVTVDTTSGLGDVTIDLSGLNDNDYYDLSTTGRRFNEIDERLSEIEKRLTILKPNDKLKDKYKVLQDLYEQYKAAEAMLYDGEDDA